MSDTPTRTRPDGPESAPVESIVGRRSISPTLAICVVAAIVAAVGLIAPSVSPFSGSDDDGGASADAAATETAEPAADPYGAVPATGDAANDAGETTEAAMIEIADFAFSGDLDLTPGQTVQVVNLDSAPHTLTASDGSFDTGIIDSGESVTFVVPDVDGTISVFCEVHPSMTAVLTITT